MLTLLTTLLITLLTAASVIVPRSAVAAGSVTDAIVDAPGSRSWVTQVSERYNDIGHGTSRLLTGAPWSFVIRGSVGTTLTIATVNPDDPTSYVPEIELGAAFEETLEEGTYRDTVSAKDTPDHPVLNIGESCRGGAGGGSFSVLDLPADLSRLWVVYDFRCNGRAVTGEVRLNEPVGPTFEVAPTQVAWPEDPVGERGRLVPVTVLNSSDRSLAVTGAVVASGADDFRVGYSSCRQVVARGFCTVYVQFAPAADGPRTGTLRVTTSEGLRTIPLTGVGATRAPAQVGRTARTRVVGPSPADVSPPTPDGTEGTGATFWELRSSGADDWIGQGRSYDFGADDVDGTPSGSDTLFSMKVRSEEGDYFDASFAPDEDHLLLPGTTIQPVVTPGIGPSTVGGLEVSGNHHGCNAVNGGFQVIEAAYTQEGRLQGIALRFRQRCDNNTDVLSGLIAWHAQTVAPTTPVGPPVVAPQRTALTLRAGHGRLRPPVRVELRGRLSVASSPASGQELVLLQRRGAGAHRWKTYKQVSVTPGRVFVRYATVRRPTRFRVRFLGTAHRASSVSRVVTVRPR